MHNQMKAGLAGAAVVAGIASAASAQTLYSQNFDSLNAGVTAVGQGAPAYEVYYFGGGSGPAATTIQNNGVGGSKGLQIDSAALTTTLYAYQPGLNLNVAGKKIRVEYAIDINPPLVSTNNARSEWVVGVFNPSGSLISGLGVGTSGTIVYTDPTGGQNFYAPQNPIFTEQGFNTLAMILDFTTATPTGVAEYNGVVLPFELGVKASAGSLIGDLDMFVSPYGVDTAVFDNLRISVVPEPVSLTLLGGVGLLARRRR